MLIMRGQKEQMHLVKICRDPSDPSLPQGGEKNFQRTNMRYKLFAEICRDPSDLSLPRGGKTISEYISFVL